MSGEVDARVVAIEVYSNFCRLTFSQIVTPQNLCLVQSARENPRNEIRRPAGAMEKAARKLTPQV